MNVGEKNIRCESPLFLVSGSLWPLTRCFKILRSFLILYVKVLIKTAILIGSSVLLSGLRMPISASACTFSDIKLTFIRRSNAHQINFSATEGDFCIDKVPKGY